MERYRRDHGKVGVTITRTSSLQRPRSATRRPRETSPVAPMRLAYLTTAYPEVSHTFIRREIAQLERRGHDVLRLSIRRGKSDLVDVDDVAEAQRTIYVLAQGGVALLLAALRVALTAPAAALRAMVATWRMCRRGDRGIVRHAAYFVEACWLLGTLKRHDVEHVHVHFGTNAATVARIVRILGGPSYSMTIHGPDELDAPRAHSLGEKIADSAMTVAISQYTAAQLRRWTNPDCWSRIHVVHCAISDDYIHEPDPVAPHGRTLVCVGRLCAQKGQLVLIDALKQVVDAGIDARLTLVGDGEMRSVIEQRIKAHELADRVTITGWASGEQVREHLRQCRAMVLPSFAEGLPVVIMEALAMARPVISTYIAGIPELVRDGACGWLVPAGDTRALARAMTDALTAPTSQLDAMGQCGRRRVRAAHDGATEAARLENLLRNHTTKQSL
jgi:glycosyltransferase involved in cell wall biosynthesis